MQAERRASRRLFDMILLGGKEDNARGEGKESTVGSGSFKAKDRNTFFIILTMVIITCHPQLGGGGPGLLSEFRASEAEGDGER